MFSLASASRAIAAELEKDLEEDFSAAKLERKREAVIPAVSRSRGQR